MNEFGIVRKMIMDSLEGITFEEYKNLCGFGSLILENLSLYDKDGLENFNELIYELHDAKKVSLTQLRYRAMRQNVNITVAKNRQYYAIYFFLVDFLTHYFRKWKTIYLTDRTIFYLRKAYRSEVVDNLLKEPFFDYYETEIRIFRRAFYSLALYHVLLYRILFVKNPLNKEMFWTAHRYIMRKILFFVFTQIALICETEEEMEKFAFYIEENPHKVFRFYCEELNIAPEDVFEGLNIVSFTDFGAGINSTTVNFILDKCQDLDYLRKENLTRKDAEELIKKLFKKEYHQVLVGSKL